MDDFFRSYGSSDSESAPAQQASEAPKSANDFFSSYPAVETAEVDHGEVQQKEAPSEQSVSRTAASEGPQEGRAEGDDEETLEDILEELDELIGLRRVKQEVRGLLQYVRVQEMRRAKGIARPQLTLHSVFYGSPGTGKTTIARIYGRMLKSLGLLSRGHLVETDRAGLIASYVGQTANKTDEKIKEALGGVLFIDEAYSLSKGEHVQWDYGSEAIEILLKRMEDYRSDFVVIAAGYPGPMRQFLNSNEGLKSRFSTYVHFDDYSPQELLQIFELFCRQESYTVGEEALKQVFSTITYHHTRRDKSFGNARFVRTLFETVTRNHALRVGTTKANPSVEDLSEILVDDIPLISVDSL